MGRRLSALSTGERDTGARIAKHEAAAGRSSSCDTRGTPALQGRDCGCARDTGSLSTGLSVAWLCLVVSTHSLRQERTLSTMGQTPIMRRLGIGPQLLIPGVLLNLLAVLVTAARAQGPDQPHVRTVAFSPDGKLL